MKRRRKSQEAAGEEPVASAAPETAQPDPDPAPPLRIVVVGPRGEMREALEADVDAQTDMEVVGSFDDIDSGTSGIRTNTRRSGVVVLVDVAVLEAAGTIAEIRRLRDRFPFCRFLAYGDAFDDDAASALVFFGADGVVGVGQGPGAVAGTIRRHGRPGEVEEFEPEPDELEDAAKAAAELASSESSALPAEPPAEVISQEDEPPPDPEPEPEPPPAPRTDQSSAEEIWPASSPPEHVGPGRRITPQDIWERRASEVRFDPPSEEEPTNGEPPDSMGRPPKAASGARSRVARTFRRPFRAERGSKDQSDPRTS